MLGKKLDLTDGMLDVSKLGRHYYVLVHNYKVVLSVWRVNILIGIVFLLDWSLGTMLLYIHMLDQDKGRAILFDYQ